MIARIRVARVALGIGLVAFAAILIWLFYPASGMSRSLPPDRVCERELERIWNALQMYRAVHGKLPPPVVRGPNGDVHSWRVLIMPYIRHEMSWLGNAYTLAEPWDSERNRTAAEIITADYNPYACPCDKASRVATSYVMLLRPSPAGRCDPQRPLDLPDKAVLIVECADCGIHWAEPRDMCWNDLREGETPFCKGKLNAEHHRTLFYRRGYVHALRFDGTIIKIPKNMSRQSLEHLLSGEE